jgi:hypothetical protein
LIRQYDRTLSESEKRILEKQIIEIKAAISNRYAKVILFTSLMIAFGIAEYFFPKIWLIIVLSVISFFIIWYLYQEISDLVRLPSFLKKKQEVIENGVARVNEINIDRFIRIDNFEDEGNHFVVEHNGMLTLLGGQEFLGVKKLKSKIEQIAIMDSKKTGIYYETIAKSGYSINPYYTFKKGLSDEFVESSIWEKLTNRKPFKGKLEDFDNFIDQDKRKKAANTCMKS